MLTLRRHDELLDEAAASLTHTKLVYTSILETVYKETTASLPWWFLHCSICVSGEHRKLCITDYRIRCSHKALDRQLPEATIIQGSYSMFQILPHEPRVADDGLSGAAHEANGNKFHVACTNICTSSRDRTPDDTQLGLSAILSSNNRGHARQGI